MMGLDGGAERRPPVSLRYYAPAPDLRRYVSFYYLFRTDLVAFGDVLRADVGQLRFVLTGQGDYRFSDGRVARMPDVCLVGPTGAATRFAVKGPATAFGVALRPAGWVAMIRGDASAHADRAEDAVAMFGPWMANALDALRHARSVANMIALADSVVRELCRYSAEPPLWFTEATDAWLTGEASPQVDTLIAKLGLSARHVERLAGRIYGAPPKLLARKYRALRAASLLGIAGASPADIVGNAFYDQSHFIRECKRFTGLTPGQLQRAPSPLVRLTRQRRGLAGLAPEIAVIS
jgi:AraC-like DNA-binding protein